jgi:hypothetical protein
VKFAVDSAALVFFDGVVLEGGSFALLSALDGVVAVTAASLGASLDLTVVATCSFTAVVAGAESVTAGAV